MNTIRINIDVDARAEKVWEVLLDVGAVHTRLAPGFVTHTELVENERVVTFASGLKARERIIAVDEQLRRLAYSVRLPDIEHHHASFEVLRLADSRCRLVWTADVIPDSAAAQVRSMMEQGSIAIAAALAQLT